LTKVFKNIKNKSNVRLLLLLPNFDEWWVRQKNELSKLGFRVVLEKIDHGHNYKSKIFRSFDFDSEYTIKIDEDIFCTSDFLNYMIAAAPSVINDKTFILTPTLSTGIPTVDRFVSQNFTEQQIQDVNQSLLNVRFGNIWGYDYSSLNSTTVNVKEWNPAEYFKAISNINTCYKGIHPVRISAESQLKIHRYTIDNISKIQRTDFFISEETYPYICNSFFMIRSAEWKRILTETRWVDLYDEVPLNLYMTANDKKMSIINNAFVVHPSYNTIGDMYTTISDEFFNIIMSKDIS
jgi:hypothetical protein